MRSPCCLCVLKTTFECLLEASSPREGAVGKQQRETQPTRKEGWMDVFETAGRSVETNITLRCCS
jgi:hypothetical protein